MLKLKETFLVLCGYKERIKNGTGYLFREILAWNIGFIRSKLSCCSSPCKQFPGGRAGVIRSASAVVCKVCPTIGGKGPHKTWVLSLRKAYPLPVFASLHTVTWWNHERIIYAWSTRGLWVIVKMYKFIQRGDSTLKELLFELTVLAEDSPAPLCSMLMRRIVN